MNDEEVEAIESGDRAALLALGYTAAVAGFIASMRAVDRRKAAAVIKRDKRAAINRLGDLIAYQTAGNWPKEPVAVRALSKLWLRDMDLSRRVGAAVGATRALTTYSSPSPTRDVSLGVLTSKPLYEHYRRIQRAQSSLARTIKDDLKKQVVRGATGKALFDPLAYALHRGFGVDHESVKTVLGFVRPRFNAVLLRHTGIGAETAAKQILSELPTDVRLLDAFEALTPWAINYAQNRSDDFTKGVSDTIMYESARALEKNLNVSELERNLMRSFGLTTRQAGWVHKFVENLDESVPFKDKVVSNYANKLLDQRLDSLSRTESMIAFNFGRQLLLTRAYDEGILPASTDKVWVTGIDERVCPICAPMDGVRVRMGEQYLTKNGKVLVPPVHPNCRCTIIPSNMFEQGIITGSARAVGANLTTDDDYALAKHMGPGLHPSGSPQAVHSAKDMKLITEADHGDIVFLSSSFMDQFRLGMGMRAENAKYVRNLARDIEDKGFPGPVILSIYEDGNMRVGDGHHRLEAAALLGLDEVPVRVLNIEGERPSSPTLKPRDYNIKERKRQRDRLKDSDDPEPLSPVSEALNEIKRKQDIRFRVPDPIAQFDQKNERIPIDELKKD